MSSSRSGCARHTLAFDAGAHEKIVGALIKRSLRGGADLRLAVAYVSDAVALLGLSGSDLRSLCLLCDPFGGQCNPSVLDRLVKRKARVLCLRHLHAKVYISNRAVVIGSPNISRGALYAGNVEAVVAVKDAADIASATRWFDEIASAARPWVDIRKDLPLFARIRTAWEKGRKRRVATVTLLDALSRPHDFPWCDYVFSLYEAETSSKQNQEIITAAKNAGLRPSPGRTGDVLERATERDRTRVERDCSGPNGSRMVVSAWVKIDNDGHVSEFVSFEDEVCQYERVVLRDGSLYTYYQPATTRLNPGHRSTRQCLQALNNGLRRDREFGKRITPRRMIDPALFSALLRGSRDASSGLE